MCGASAVEVCTAALYWGPNIYGKIAKELEDFVKQSDYADIEELKARNELQKPEITESCTACMICERSCPSRAIRIEKRGKGTITDSCTRCGLCITICPVRAIV